MATLFCPKCKCNQDFVATYRTTVAVTCKCTVCHTYVRAYLHKEEKMKLGDPNATVERKLEFFRVREDSAPLEITLKCTEFTCRCPVTNQPDWATIVIEYQPHFKCVESKSLKLYLESYRDEGIFHELLAQEILKDFVETLQPAWCAVTVHFNTRGGIAISAKAKYVKAKYDVSLEASYQGEWIELKKEEEEVPCAW